jgi:LysR family malonate utilization transcriptional regulator
LSLKARRPDLEAALVLGSNTELMRKLRDGTIDAALIGLPTGDAEIESQWLLEDDIFFAAPEGDLSACAQERFVSLGEGFVTTQRIRCSISHCRVQSERGHEDG